MVRLRFDENLPIEEIFKYFDDFDNGLHKNNCRLSLKYKEEQRQEEPNLLLKFLKKQYKCSCSEKFLEKVEGILNDFSETTLVEFFKVGRYCWPTLYNEDIVLSRVMSHLHDISLKKGLKNLQRELQVTDLSGYEEIFQNFVDFENTLHEKNCITFLPLSGTKEQMREMPKQLRLKLFDKMDECKCSENFLDKMKDTLHDVQESKLVHIFKVYLQGYDKDVACRLVSHLQDMCISKNLPVLASYCFQTIETEKLMQILTERFDELSDQITAVIISELENKSLFYNFFEIFEKDKVCLTPNETGFDFFYYTIYQQIAYRGMTDSVSSKTYQALTNAKWENWCRRAIVTDAVMYLTSIVFLTFVAVISVNAPNVVVYQSPLDYTRAIFEIILLLNAARILGIEIFQTIRLKKEYLVDKMNIVEITSPVMMILLLPVRYIHEQTHWYIYAVTYLVWFLQIIKYAPVFKFTGVFVDSLQKMLVKDILRFGIVLFITIVVFSGTFLLVLKAENTLQLHEETTSFWKIGIVGIRIMIESDGIVEYTGDEGYKFAGTMVMMAFMFFITIVLLNMLIAKLMNTYKEIENTSLNGFYVRRAKIVARLEREHMPFPFNIFKTDDKRKSFYMKILYGDVKIFLDRKMSDTEKVHDDSLTIQQNLEDRLKEISNTLQELKSCCVSLRDSVNHLESYKNEIANLHKNDDAAEAATCLEQR